MGIEPLELTRDGEGFGARLTVPGQAGFVEAATEV